MIRLQHQPYSSNSSVLLSQDERFYDVAGVFNDRVCKLFIPKFSATQHWHIDHPSIYFIWIKSVLYWLIYTIYLHRYTEYSK